MINDHHHHPIADIKMNRVTIIITTLFHLASANLSKQELYQNALRLISNQQAIQLHRGLVSEECVSAQVLLNESGINDNAEPCGFSFTSDDYAAMNCEFREYSIDSDACSDLDGRIVSVDYEYRCVGILIHFHNLPTCLHNACNEDTIYVDGPVSFPNDDEYDGITCEMIPGLSGANPPDNSKTKAVVALVVITLLTIFLSI